MNARTLHTKHLILPAILALATGQAVGQVDGGCGSNVTPEGGAQALLNEAAGMYELGQAADGLAYQIVRVKMHIVRQTSGAGGIDPAAIQSAMVLANGFFAPSRILLIPQRDVDYIDSDEFYFNINTEAEINALRAVRPQANMLNIYFTPNLAYEGGGLCGISSFTFSISQGIVMANSCMPGSFAHEIGHYFDLYHTHETFFGAECASGSNCTTAGDLLCDTPADPGLIQNGAYVVNAQCQYTGITLDPCALAAYSPDTTNIMAYTPQPCRTHFTSLQSSRAQATLLNLRPAHRVASPDLATAIHTDSSAASGGNGTWLSPYNFFGFALASTPTGGVLAIARADGNEGPGTLSRKMIIYNCGPEPANGGPPVVIRIGAP